MLQRVRVRGAERERKIVQWMLLQRALIEIFLGHIKASFTVWPSKLRDKDFLYCLEGRIARNRRATRGSLFECPNTTKPTNYDKHQYNADISGVKWKQISDVHQPRERVFDSKIRLLLVQKCGCRANSVVLSPAFAQSGRRPDTG